MIASRGRVFRLLFADADSSAPPRKEWLTRSDALFAADEWGWSSQVSEAYTFPTYSAASTQADALQPSFSQPLTPIVVPAVDHRPNEVIPAPA